MKRAFTIAEILIVAAILGILAAIALPQLQAHVRQAKESAAKDNLRTLRNAIELYADQHNGIPPGYPDNDPTQIANFLSFFYQFIRDGENLSGWPENPFNELVTVRVIPDDAELPMQATGEYGWIYKPATKDFRIDWPGTDSQGVRFYDY
jgi:prepilin-type N-terminal cleavage/methylation domain-containing protein